MEIIKTTKEIKNWKMYSQYAPLDKKWIPLAYIRNELGLLRDAIKQGKPALPCVDVLIEELDALSKPQADKKSVS